MKTLQILAISSLLLGLSQAANADHHEMNHDHAGNHAHGWQDADTNKDGVVTKDEFLVKHQQHAEKKFAKMDTNKDGKLDEAERKAMHAKCDRHAK